MKRRQIPSTMKLIKETIRKLGSAELDRIAGAGPYTDRTVTCTCPPA